MVFVLRKRRPFIQGNILIQGGLLSEGPSGVDWGPVWGGGGEADQRGERLLL